MTPPLLERIGLHRRELRAWAMYDWANSAFWTTVIVAVFPPFFSDYAAPGIEPPEATARFAWGTTVAVAVSATLGPIFGAMADYRAWKKRLLAVFMTVGVVATALSSPLPRCGCWRSPVMRWPMPRSGPGLMSTCSRSPEQGEGESDRFR